MPTTPPVVETPVTIVSEQLPEPEPAPVPAPAEPIVAEPILANQTEPKPIDFSSPDPIISQGSIPQKVLALTDEELKAAYKLWGTRTIRNAQVASTKASHIKLEQHLDKVRAYVKSHPNSRVNTIARECNFSTPNTSYYLSLLLAKGQVTAVGATSSRRYS